MTEQTPKMRYQRRSHRLTTENGLPYLAARLPADFRSAANVNDFIYSLTVEATAGRVDSRRAAILGYLSQLAIQTLPQLRIDAQPTLEDQKSFVQAWLSNIPRPDYSKRGSSAPDANLNAEITERMAAGMSQREARRELDAMPDRGFERKHP